MFNGVFIGFSSAGMSVTTTSFTILPFPATTGSITIAFDGNKDYTLFTATGNITLVLGTGNVENNEIQIVLDGNSSNSFTLPATWINVNGNTFDNTKRNRIWMKYNNGQVLYEIIKSIIPDTTAPVIQSAVTNSAGTLITLTYNDTLYGTPAYTLSGGHAITSQTIVGMTVQLVPTIAIAVAEVLTVSGGGVTDVSLNSVATLSAYSVTNNTTLTRLEDSFTSANTADIAGRTPAIGGNWAKGIGAGTIGILSNEANCSSSNTLYVSEIGGTGDIDISITVGTVGVSYASAIIASWVNSSNYISVPIDGEVEQTVGGVYSLLQGTTGASIAGDVYRVTIAGTTLKVYRNGSQVGSNITINSDAKGTKAGISMASTNTIRDVIAS